MCEATGEISLICGAHLLIGKYLTKWFEDGVGQLGRCHVAVCFCGISWLELQLPFARSIEIPDDTSQVKRKTQIPPGLQEVQSSGFYRP